MLTTHPTEPKLHLIDGRLYVEITPYEDANGYLCVSITTGGVTRHEKLHRLLWEFYNQQAIPEGLMVRHLNDDKQDNREVNLALGSHRDNMDDRRKNKGDPIGEKNPARKLDDQSVREIRRRFDAGEGITSLAREFSFVSRSTIASVVLRKTWKHVE